MSTSDATNFELNARHQMFFHYLRLSAALEAFKNDKYAGHQQWWMRNLKSELNNALTFVGLCTVRHWNVQVPNLICLLSEALLDKHNSYVLSPTSQIWKEVYVSDLEILGGDQLHLAWWAYPGGNTGRFTFDELEEAFEQFLLQSALSMEDIEKLGNLKTDRHRQRKPVAAELFVPLLSSVEAAKEKNLKDIRDHQVAMHASAFLRKKYEASPKMVPTCAQVELYATEFNDFLATITETIKRPNTGRNRIFTGACDGPVDAEEPTSGPNPGASKS